MEENTIYEESVIVKLFHNVNLQKMYLPDLLYGIFIKHKLLAYIMKNLFDKGIEITLENIYLVQNSKKVKRYAYKNNIELYTRKELEDLLINNYQSNTSDSLFEEAYNVLHDNSFFRYIEKAKEDFTYEIAYSNVGAILSRARAIIKLYNILYGRKIKQRKDTLLEAVTAINEKQSFVPTFSNALNNIIGGFSKGFVASIIARPSHGKSTIMTWTAIHGLMNKILDRIDIISGEEISDVFWRRVISAYFKIPSSSLRLGTYTVTESQYKELKEFVDGRLFFHPVTTLNDTVRVINTIKDSSMIWVDHINAIAYPNRDDVNGIKSLVSSQKEYLSYNSNTVIVNLSQVNTKTMKFKGRLFPTKEDAFNSSALEQASREFLSIYYPYLDSIDPELKANFRRGAKKKDAVSINKVLVSIEKTSFGGKGIIELDFQNEIGRYKDVKKKQTSTNVILPEANEEFEFEF